MKDLLQRAVYCARVTLYVGLMVLVILIITGCKRYDVIEHYQKAGVMPHGTNKKLNKYEQKK
jgi:hypothetical protein